MRGRRARTLLALPLLVALASCNRSGSEEPPPDPPAPPVPGVQVRVVASAAGRLDWSSANGQVAIDLLEGDGYFDVWVMSAEATDRRCLTCDRPELPNRHTGNPGWHPSGEYIVFQAQKATAPPNPISDFFANPGAGVNNDLWLMDRAGGRFWRLTDVDLRSGGVLHPQFSPDGSRLVWSDRVSATGGRYGEWRILLADFAFENDRPVLRNVRAFQPGAQRRFYETHGFTPDGRELIFSGNLEAGQDENGLDVYRFNPETGALTNLTQTMTEWDEHAHASPTGRIAWMSSRESGAAINPSDLWTDYWLMRADGTGRTRLTYFNQGGHPHFLAGGATAADFAWNADGTALLGYVILDQQSGASRLVRVDVPANLPSSTAASPVAAPATARAAEIPSSRVGASQPATMRRIDVAAAGDAARLWDREVERWRRRGVLEIVAVADDPLVPGRRHERLRQLHRGVPIDGADLTRQSAGGAAVSVFGVVYENLGEGRAPASMTPAEAEAAIGAAVGARPDPRQAPELIWLPEPAGGLRLAYAARVVTAAGSVLRVLVDAVRGGLVRVEDDRRFTTQDREPPVLDVRNRPGRLAPLLAGDPPRPSDELPAGPLREAIVAGERRALECLRAHLGRRTVLDAPVLHVAGMAGEQDMAGEAWYAGLGVIHYRFEPGDSVEPDRIADVVAHELAHATVHRAAGLRTDGHAGALDEAFAIWLAGAASGWHEAGIPDWQQWRDPGRWDLSGHATSLSRTGDRRRDNRRNAAVPGRAWLLALGGVDREDRALFERTVARAVVDLLPSDATFGLARAAMLQSARDLAPGHERLQRAIADGWAVVGLR